jgi:flagellar hook-length control protein FliK
MAAIMQTPTVQNQSNVNSSSSSHAKSQTIPDVPFNQLLTHQIAERGNDAAKAQDTNKASDTSQAGKPNTDSVSKKSDATDTKAAGKDKDTDTDDNAQATDGTPGAVSAELMALVANHLKQLNEKADPTAASEPKDKTVKIDLRTSLASTRADAQSKDIASGEAKSDASITEEMGKGAAGKAAPDFAARMAAIEQQADPKQSLQAAASKLHDALPEISNNGAAQLQQTALNMTQSASGQPTDKLTPPVGTPAWDQALGQKVVWMVGGGQQSAALTLNPPDLGPMQVVLHVSNGQADASFTANQPEVRAALEAAMPKLREMMSDAGIQLGQATISAGMPDQQNKSGEQSGSGQNSRGSFGQSNEAADAPARVIGTTKITSGQGLVDTYV